MDDPINADDLILRTIKEEAEHHANEAAQRHSERLHRRRIDWDVRGILAILSIVGVFALAGVNLVYKGDANIPAWAATIAATISTYYFVTKAANGNRRKDD